MLQANYTNYGDATISLQYVPDDKHDRPGFDGVGRVHHVHDADGGDHLGDGEEQLVPDLLVVVVVEVVEVGPPGVVVRVDHRQEQDAHQGPRTTSS